MTTACVMNRAMLGSFPMRLLRAGAREHAGARGSTQQEHAAGVLRPAPQRWAWGGHIGAAPWRNRSTHSTVRYYTSPYCSIIGAGRLQHDASASEAEKACHGGAARASSSSVLRPGARRSTQEHAGARTGARSSKCSRVLPCSRAPACSRHEGRPQRAARRVQRVLLLPEETGAFIAIAKAHGPARRDATQQIHFNG